MTYRVLWLLASLLLALTITQAQAAAPRFATGFLIYKSVASDTPVYYNGLLYISAAPPSALWTEYDIGQPKPFRIQTSLVVREIKFGALFSGDFTTEQHVEFCRGIQAQLAAVAPDSPNLKNAAQALIASIQTEIDRYKQEQVRFRGNWISLLAYKDILVAEEKQRTIAMAEKQAADDKVKAEAAAVREAGRQRILAKEAYEAEEKIRRDNLTRRFNAYSARQLSAHFDSFMAVAADLAAAGHFLRVPYTPDPKAIPVPRHPKVNIELRTDPEGSENALSILCAYDQNSRIVVADIAFILVSDSTRQNLLNKAEIDAVRTFVRGIDEVVFSMLPDMLSAANIMRVLRKDSNLNNVVAYDAQLPGIDITFGIGAVNEYSDSRFRQFVIIRIRPAA